jgi:hypothetical protein
VVMSSRGHFALMEEHRLLTERTHQDACLLCCPCPSYVNSIQAESSGLAS